MGRSEESSSGCNGARLEAEHCRGPNKKPVLTRDQPVRALSRLGCLSKARNFGSHPDTLLCQDIDGSCNSAVPI
eukprot:10454306-Prorocentrum_lima.AAC.1